MADKKETKTQRMRRLRAENRAKAKAQATRNTKTFASGVADMLFGDKTKPKAKPPTTGPNGAAARRTRSTQTGTSYRTRQEARKAPPQTSTEANRRAASKTTSTKRLVRNATAGGRRRIADVRARNQKANLKIYKQLVKDQAAIDAKYGKKKPTPSKPTSRPSPKIHPSVTQAGKRFRGIVSGLTGIGGKTNGAGGLLSALSIGMGAGQWAEKNWDKGVSTSGRGAGRKTFEEGNKKRDKAKNPPKAKNTGPKAVEGGYTISKKTRQQLQSERIKKKQQADIDAYNKAKEKNSTKLKQQQKPKVQPTVRPSAGNGGGSNKPAKPAAKPAPKRNEKLRTNPNSDKRIEAWAKANRKMIEKSGTRKQREILRRALGSNANQKGWQGNRNT